MNLQDLIADRKAGRSYEQLSRDCGGSPTAGRLQQIATSPLRSFPDPDTIRSLAIGLRVPPRAVVTAAAESLGLPIESGSSQLEAWLPSKELEALHPSQVDAILAVIRAMLDEPARAAARSQHVTGGTLLFVPDVPHPHDLDSYALALEVLQASFDDPDAATMRALQFLARKVAPALGVTLREHGTRAGVSPAPGAQAQHEPSELEVYLCLFANPDRPDRDEWLTKLEEMGAAPDPSAEIVRTIKAVMALDDLEVNRRRKVIKSYRIAADEVPNAARPDVRGDDDGDT